MSQPSDQSFRAIATDRTVVTRAAKIALVVGTILAMINHGDRMMAADIDITRVFKILLTYLVPYCVSTYSSVLAIRGGLQTRK